MKTIFTFIFSFLVLCANAQVGIGTTSPNSTLDVRGSLSLNNRSFASSETASSTDNALVYTGTSAATITLPDATTITGRMYNIKNFSTTVPTPVLTIATSLSQTIDQKTSRLLYLPNEAVNIVSNGTNWVVTSTTRTMGNQPYGSVSSSINQFNTSTTTSRSITYDTDEILNLISHSTISNPERIHIQVEGTYLITFSAQLRGAAADIDIWLRQNGADVPRTNSRSSLQNANDYRLLVVTFIVPAIANDYFELVQSTTNINAGLAAVGTLTNPTRPAIPSIIVTINKVSD